MEFKDYLFVIIIYPCVKKNGENRGNTSGSTHIPYTRGFKVPPDFIAYISVNLNGFLIKVRLNPFLEVMMLKIKKVL